MKLHSVLQTKVISKESPWKQRSQWSCDGVESYRNAQYTIDSRCIQGELMERTISADADTFLGRIVHCYGQQTAFNVLEGYKGGLRCGFGSMDAPGVRSMTEGISQHSPTLSQGCRSVFVYIRTNMLLSYTSRRKNHTRETGYRY